MNKEALKTQVRLLKRLTQVALGIETEGNNYCAGGHVFFIEEDLSLLKVLLGEKDAMYKNMVSLKDKIDLKIAANKEHLVYL